MKENTRRARARNLCIEAQTKFDAEVANYKRITAEGITVWHRACKLLREVDRARDF
jgi:hypothetical protein